MPFEKLIMRVLHGIHLYKRPLTIGVRGAVFDEKGRIFLVRHTYVSGWYMPGGGVDPGETALAALKRELAEEANIELADEPKLVGVYFNRNASNRDHVLFYSCGAFRQSEPKRPDAEIAETGFFPLDELPDGTTAATRRRLEELSTGEAPDKTW